ncbi:MAG TPA: methyltransferase domain-containing protein [Planctomycetota bacterium]|nr:methyltransferase domain-containing protein [Planctomycetota bacterium]
MPIRSKAYDRKRQRLIAGYAIGPDVLDLGYAQSPNVGLRAFRTVGLDLERSRQPSGYAEEIVGDAMDLAASLGQRKFNTIVAAELLEHLEAPYAFLRGLHPFLADGGRLILSTPNPLGFPIGLCELFRVKRFYYCREHRYAFPARWVERMLDVAGFEPEAVRAVGLQLIVAAPPCPKCLSYQLVYVARKRAGGGRG